MYRFKKDTTPGRLDHAKEAAETALRLAPKLPQSHLAKAQYYYYGLHDYERTQRELAAAPSPSADNAKFVDLAALTERRLGRWRDAIRDGEKAVELDPQNPFITNELVESYTSVRRFTEAERLANPPRDMTHLYRSVLVAVFARDFDRAFQLLENATPVEKESDTVPFFDGIVARAQHNAARAGSSFQLARARMVMKLRERPADAELISNLSVVDAGLGFKENALHEAKRAIE